MRFISNKKDGSNLAEMEVYGYNKRKLQGLVIGFPQKSKDRPYSFYYPFEKAFDGDYDTFFESGAANVGWAGLDLGKPMKISEIKYAPQSDTNFIIPGDLYELCYWNYDNWQRAGKKIGLGNLLNSKEFLLVVCIFLKICQGAMKNGYLLMK